MNRVGPKESESSDGKNPNHARRIKGRKPPRQSRNQLLRFLPGAKFRNYIIEDSEPFAEKKRRTTYVTPLGEGGSSMVYLALQQLAKGVQIPRALKFFIYRDDIAVLTANRRRGPVNTRDFLSEVVNISRFSHEHLVKVTDAGVLRRSSLEIPYLVTEFIEGPTLKDVISAQMDSAAGTRAADVKAQLIRDPQRALELLICVASAIEVLHNAHFAHCDIAPKNIFIRIGEGLKPVLGDLGVGRTISATSRVRVLGTKAYMPLFASKHLNCEVDGATFQSLQPAWDIFSLGKTGLELLSIFAKPFNQSWITPAGNLFEQCIKIPHSLSIAAIRERLQWLRPVERQMADVPELSASISGQRHMLMPVEALVATHRFRQLVQHPALLRLSRVRQMTNAYQTFPGASHSRYEHSLGTLETMRRYLMALLDHSDFLDHLSSGKIETALLCSLFFSLTRFPYDNLFREIRGPETKTLTSLSKPTLLTDILNIEDVNKRKLLDLVKQLFPRVAEKDLRCILGDDRTQFEHSDELIHSLLNNSLDVRVVDFVRRDALHLGLAGATFRLAELLPHLRIHNHHVALNITGVSIAEEIISLRYWLFHRVHWCIPNRAFVAMMQYLVMELLRMRSSTFVEELAERVLEMSDEAFLKFMEDQALKSDSPALLDLAGLLNSNEPRLYKLSVQLSTRESPEFGTVCDKLRNANTGDFVALGNELSRDCHEHFTGKGDCSEKVAIVVDLPHEPGIGNKLGNDVIVLNEGRQEQLAQISGIIGGINGSFEASVRKLRVFVHPELFPVGDDARTALQMCVKESLLKRYG